MRESSSSDGQDVWTKFVQFIICGVGHNIGDYEWDIDRSSACCKITALAADLGSVSSSFRIENRALDLDRCLNDVFAILVCKLNRKFIRSLGVASLCCLIEVSAFNCN
jgi:hypothetical protein